MYHFPFVLYYLTRAAQLIVRLTLLDGVDVSVLRMRVADDDFQRALIAGAVRCGAVAVVR